MKISRTLTNSPDTCDELSENASSYSFLNWQDLQHTNLQIILEVTAARSQLMIRLHMQNVRYFMCS